MLRKRQRACIGQNLHHAMADGAPQRKNGTPFVVTFVTYLPRPRNYSSDCSPIFLPKPVLWGDYVTLLHWSISNCEGACYGRGKGSPVVFWDSFRRRRRSALHHPKLTLGQNENPTTRWPIPWPRHAAKKKSAKQEQRHSDGCGLRNPAMP